MAAEKLNQSTSFNHVDNETAPRNGAVSLFDGQNLKHGRPIEYAKGLVNPDALLEFMDRCHCEDVGWTPGNHRMEHHHLYFPEGEFKLRQTAPPFSQLRNNKLNLIYILSCQEELYHQTVAQRVSKEWLDPEAAQVFNEESNHLTNFVATSGMIAITNALLDRRLLPRGARKALRTRAEILEEMRIEDENNVARIELVQPTVLVGALKLYLESRREEGLEAYIAAHFDEDMPTITTRTHSDDTLKNIMMGRLKKRFDAGRWIAQKQVLTPLLAEAA